MIWRVAVIILFALAGVVRADDDAHRAQISAATANAVDNMLADIEAEQISSSVMVHQFLDKTGSRAQLLAAVQQAQQIGGPRWVDDQTCQVRLELRGSVLSKQLIEIAAGHAGTTPVSADEMKKDLAAWDARVFSATGTSTARIEALRPPVTSQAWKNVSDDEAQRAVATARQNAVTRVLDSIGPVPLAGDKKIGDALALHEIGDAMTGWLTSRPVTMVNFREDHKVEVTLSVSAANVYEKVRALLGARKDLPLPGDEKSWGALADGISRAMATPVGLGAVIPSTQPTKAIVFAQPPDWVDRQLDAQGNATFAQSKLRTARLAENDAMAKLLEEVRSLPVGDGLKLGAAADRDPRLKAALDRTMRRGPHVYNVEYQANGDVGVRISLDLRVLWEEIASGQ